MEPGQVVAPTAAVAPTPAPVAPAAPVAPVATPAAPAAPEAPVQTPEQIAEAASDAEWEQANKNIYPELDKKDKQDEPAKPEKTPEEIAADEAAANETPEQQAERQNKEAEAAAEAAKTNESDSYPAPVPLTPREYADAVAKGTAEIMKTVFAETPTTLQDADGDPINGIDDVMKLINPRTNELFTEEQAGYWLNDAQRKLDANKATVEKRAQEIAVLNVDIKEQVGRINHKYGAYLKAHTDLRDKLHKEFVSSLELDDKTQVITKMPMSLETYYENVLEPRITAEKAATTDATTAAPAAAEKTPEEVAAAAAQAKKTQTAAKQQKMSDRSDIYAAPTANAGQVDEDDKEWDEAMKAEFPQLRDRK